MRKVVVALVALVLVGAGIFLVRGHGLEKKPSQTLPAVTLTSLGGTGSAVDLRTLKGPVVLNFWAQWCGPCRKELPYYQQFHTASPSVRLIGINSLDRQTALAQQMVRSKGLTYPQVTDPDGKVSGTKALPVLVMVDARGKVVYRKAIQIHSVGQLQQLVRAHLGTAS